MFIHGRGHKTLSSPARSEFPCPACSTKGTSVVVVDYDYAHIFWIFGGLKNEVVTMSCKACLAGRQLNANEQSHVFSQDAKNPVPFMDRYGAYVLIVLFVAWFAFAFTFPCAVNPTSDACLDSR